jgi:hypothetical protein
MDDKSKTDFVPRWAKGKTQEEIEALSDCPPIGSQPLPDHTPGPWKPVRSVTCGHLRAEHNYCSDPKKEWTEADIRLIADAPKMLELIRELHDFAEPMRHWEYAERGRQAFRDAAILIGQHGG